MCKRGTLRVVRSTEDPLPYDGSLSAGDWRTTPVPTGKVWRVVGLSFYAQASAVVGNRFAGFEVLNGQGRLDAQVFGAITASQKIYLTLTGAAVGGSIPDGFTRDSFNFNKDLWVPSGAYLHGFMLSNPFGPTPAGDQMGAVQITVIEYDDGELP